MNDLAGPGAIAQLGERLLCKQEVTGSIPVGSTRADETIRHRLRRRRREFGLVMLAW